MYVIAPFEKKIKNFFFQKKSCDWIIFFQVSRFECPHCSRLLIVPYFPWDRKEQAFKQGFVQVMEYLKSQSINQSINQSKVMEFKNFIFQA